jgi:hypothetical protein
LKTRSAVWIAGLSLLALAGCEDFNWPYHRASEPIADKPGDTGAGDNATECANIQAEIKNSEETRREAPTTSTNPDIVDAAQGKADKRIDDLRQRYDSLDCPSADASSDRSRLPPLQPAPGGGNR